MLQGSLPAIGPVNQGLLEEFSDFEVAKRAKVDNDDSEENEELI